MGKKQRKFTATFKSKVAVELIKEQETVSAICSRYRLHPTQAQNWKKQLIQGVNTVFEKKQSGELEEKQQLIEELYKQIGQLKVELDWLKKKSEIL